MASASTPPTGACGDSEFGPIVSTADCRGGFDFTVAFESGILNILPAACFLLPATYRLFQLSRQSPKVLSSADLLAVAEVLAGLDSQALDDLDGLDDEFELARTGNAQPPAAEKATPAPETAR
mgnify:CR=1 FL=1